MRATVRARVRARVGVGVGVRARVGVRVGVTCFLAGFSGRPSPRSPRLSSGSEGVTGDLVRVRGRVGVRRHG